VTVHDGASTVVYDLNKHPIEIRMYDEVTPRYRKQATKPSRSQLF
jgi:hypothetical protein